MKKIVILISGRGSNMEAVVRACAREGWPARVCAVISNKPDAAGLAFAAANGIETQVVDHRQFDGREAFDAALAREIDRHAPDPIMPDWIAPDQSAQNPGAQNPGARNPGPPPLSAPPMDHARPAHPYPQQDPERLPVRREGAMPRERLDRHVPGAGTPPTMDVLRQVLSGLRKLT